MIADMSLVLTAIDEAEEYQFGIVLQGYMEVRR
jgi:hypothetical protein